MYKHLKLIFVFLITLALCKLGVLSYNKEAAPEMWRPSTVALALNKNKHRPPAPPRLTIHGQGQSVGQASTCSCTSDIEVEQAGIQAFVEEGYEDKHSHATDKI